MVETMVSMLSGCWSEDVLLPLGAGESGKSTIVKQMKWVFRFILSRCPRLCSNSLKSSKFANNFYFSLKLWLCIQCFLIRDSRRNFLYRDYIKGCVYAIYIPCWPGLQRPGLVYIYSSLWQQRVMIGWTLITCQYWWTKLLLYLLELWFIYVVTFP